MRILLVGEYSHFHNSLRDGLVALGHEVTIISDNDFKNYPVDFNFYAKFFKDNYMANKFRQLLFRITGIDLAQYETAYRFWLQRKNFTGYDIVQLVNEWALQTPPHIEVKLLKHLFENNKEAYLVSCGDDYVCVSYMLTGKFKYCVLTPYEEFPHSGTDKYTLRYVTKPFKKLHDYVYAHIRGVVAGDMDYYIPLREHPKSRGLIGYPINTQKQPFSPLEIKDKVVIFHGINEANYYKKGSYIFEKALALIEAKYADKVEIITTRSVPYAQYIESYNKAHIVLDQIFAYDQGYNALEAMARGKVVFTGAETEFMQYYGLTGRVAVNALPDAGAIAKELEFLIENPREISAMGERARAFVEKEHDYVTIAKRYVAFWLT